MDYSLLLIIINNSDEKTEDDNIENISNEINFKRIIFKSNDKKYTYVLGIIDFLQYFNLKKFLENKFKNITQKDKQLISAVDPLVYSKRFYDFMTMKVFKSKSWFHPHSK